MSTFNTISDLKRNLGQIFQTIKNKYCEKQTKQQVFVSFFSKDHQNTQPNISIIDQCFDLLAKNQSIKETEGIDEKQKHLLQIISSIYSLYDKAIYFIPHNTSEYFINFLPQNPRYGIKAKESISKNTLNFTVVDYFHNNQVKILKPVNIQISEDSKMYVLDEKKIVFTVENQRDLMILLKLDFEKLECNVLFEKHVPYYFSRGNLFFSGDGKKFTSIQNDDWNLLTIEGGKIENDEIKMDEQMYANYKESMVLFGPKGLRCHRFFEDNKIGLIRAMYKKDDESFFAFKYMEIDFNCERKILTEKFKTQIEVEANEFQLSDNYTWAKNKCYVLGLTDSYLNYIVCFDLEAQNSQIIQTIVDKSFLKFDEKIKSNFFDLQIDENDILTFRSSNLSCRMSLRKPDKLKNVCWQKICHDSNFYGSNLYVNAMKLLPPNDELQAFSNLY